MNTKHLVTASLLAVVFFGTATFVDAQRFFRPRFQQRTVRQTEKETMNAAAVELKVLLDLYQSDALKLFKDSTHAEWDAMTTGKEEAFKKSAAMKLAFAKFHSDPVAYAKIKELRAKAVGLSKIDVRAAERMERAYEQNQLPPELLQKMLDMSSEIEQIFQNQRGELDGKKFSNNALLERLEKETDSAKRQKIWESLKQVGELVNGKVIALAKVRNEAAKKLGFKNFWEMQIHFQDYKPAELLALFDELEKTTTPLFAEMKAELDAELAAKFKTTPDTLMPWHYDNPFFQQAPPSKAVDPNIFYKGKTKEEIIDIAVKYYKQIGLPYEEVLKRSDLFEREGKNQHAFSTDMDTLGDVRNLCNVKPTVEWMDTVLHEGGHGVYSLECDRSLPFNLRDSAHIFTTEAIAMMFGAKARTPQWMIAFAGISPDKANAVADALKKQRRREQLIFCRWTLVMLNFEKSLYELTSQEGADADLKTLWWDMVEKYQLLKRPPNRQRGDWASKPHFVIAPVYYHNYMLGELFAAQIRSSFGKMVQNDDPSLGAALTEKVFRPGASLPWEEFVQRATGEPLSPKAFSKELKP